MCPLDAQTAVQCGLEKAAATYAKEPSNTNPPMRTHAPAGVLLLVLLCVFQGTRTVWAKEAGDQPASIRTLLNHADTMYWFGLEGRSLPAARKGLQFIREAERLLEQAERYWSEGNRQAARKLAYGTAEPPAGDLGKHLAGLRAELVALRDSDLSFRSRQLSDTHYGFFPISRLIRPTLFSDPRATGLIEVLDDPVVVATRAGINAAISQLKLSSPQHDVFFVSQPHNPDLDHEATFLFHHNGFSVHNRRELVALLTEKELAEVAALAPSPATLQKLMDYATTGNLALVRSTKIDEVGGRNYYMLVEGKEYKRRWLIGWENTIKHGCWSIDRRDMLIPAILLHVVMLVLAVFVYRLLVRYSSLTGAWPTWGNSLTVAGLGFIWGRLLVWALAPLLRSIEPAPETLALWAFWWPAATGAAFIIGPAAVVQFAQRRFQGLANTLGVFNRGGPFLAAVTLGSGTFMAQSLLFFLGSAGWWGVLPILAAAATCGFLVGRALDETDPAPLWIAGAAVAGALLIGIAWCHADVTWVNLASAFPVALFLGWWAVTSEFKSAEDDELATRPAVSLEGDAPSCQLLMLRALDPPFHETASFARVREAFAPWRDGRTVRVAVVGAAGSGKSSTLRQLQRESLEALPDAKILKGNCSEPQDGANPQPFEPFSEAIARQFAVNLLAPPSQQMRHIDDALGGVFGTVVPFANILFPSAGNGAGGSKSEVFIAISTMFRRLASRQPVILMLDDAHWMDPASVDLLYFLLEQFPAGGDCPLAIVTASREAPPTDALQAVELSPPTTDELFAILVEGLKLHSSAAESTVEMVGPQRDNLFCLFQIVVTAARRELFEWRGDAYYWRDSIDISDQIPDDYRQSIEQTLAEHPEYRPVLECAACQGTEFTVESVSSGLGMPRLDVIHMLDEIELRTGLIQDVRSKDDHFTFRSTFLLEVLRKILEVSARGPTDASTPQRYREYHGRMAQSLERTLQQSPAMVYPVANHYFAAGARFADKARQYALQAAKAASRQYQHDLARKYVEMARQCATVAGADESELEIELLLIECHAAHVEGKDRVDTARRMQDHLAAHPDAPFVIYHAAAQAAYDAGIDTRDQQYFAQCAEIAQAIIERFDGPREQAEGFHFWGISLPPSTADVRRQKLEQAQTLAACLPDEDTASVRLKARIANSLAEQLSYGNEADRETARRLFEFSIALKSRDDIHDIPGLAVAHGGLGRLYFFADTPDYDLAEHHFREDLEYSEKIGSLTGQTKMHSLIAACKLQQKDVPAEQRYERALRHYEAAHAAAEEQFDAFFALAGLIECLETLGRHADAQARGEELWRLVSARLESLPDDLRETRPSAAVPGPCIGPLRKILDICPACRDATWRGQLRHVLDDRLPPSSETAGSEQ